jgi:hypothetical protein
MRYIISESRLGEIVLRFVKEKDFVDDAHIEDGEVIIYLKQRIPQPDEIRELADQIKSMFDYHGQIYKPSNPRWTYKIVHNF